MAKQIQYCKVKINKLIKKKKEKKTKYVLSTQSQAEHHRRYKDPYDFVFLLRLPPVQ